MSKARIAGIIPARYGSTRLPGKPLAKIAGKTMIEWVYSGCARCELLDSVVVATDDPRIRDAVRAFGGEAVMTRADHMSGTDRVAEAAAGMDADVIVNIQGDQPFIDATMIGEAIAPMLREPAVEIATLMYRVTRDEDFSDPGVVKVVVDLHGNALYFSRSLIPYPREAVEHGVYEHVGTYVYRRAALQRITQLLPTVLERVEALEQLRWLQHGIRIRVVESSVRDKAFCGFSVDTPEDIGRAETMLLARPDAMRV